MDPLVGLKENVIIGKLIPAGTGIRRYREVKVDVDDAGIEDEIDFADDEDDEILELSVDEDIDESEEDLVSVEDGDSDEN